MLHSAFSRPVLGVALLAIAALPSAVSAQRVSPNDWVERCREWGDRRTERHCEVREETLAVPSSGLRVNARPNGGITVTGWDRNEVMVRAKIQTWARRMSDAEAIATEVRVQTASGSIESDGPQHRDRAGWSVSYEIFAPRTLALDLETTNGGLQVIDIQGQLGLRTTNGGISLDGVGGDVRARTTNGGVRVNLAGARWEGAGLDVRTTNGGVRLVVPENFSAHLETGTTNGALTIDFPIQVQGQISRRISTDLGAGGATIRAITTNGGVTVTRN